VQSQSCWVTAVSGTLTRVEACIPALRRYAAALLRSRDVADDLVHDCLVRALAKLHTRRDDADVRAWLFAIMHNLFISQLRRAKARPAGEPLDETHEAAMSLRPDQENSLQWRDPRAERAAGRAAFGRPAGLGGGSLLRRGCQCAGDPDRNRDVSPGAWP
jgi:DNA-directed RNA polymerase specialized sigma24 family protein